MNGEHKSAKSVDVIMNDVYVYPRLRKSLGDWRSPKKGGGPSPIPVRKHKPFKQTTCLQCKINRQKRNIFGDISVERDESLNESK